MRSYVILIMVLLMCVNLYADIDESTDLSPKRGKELLFVQIESGYSWMQKADISGATFENSWDLANEGYNAPLSNSAFLGFAIGVKPLSFLDMNFSYGLYEIIHYEKYQTGTDAAPGFTGNCRIRYFDLNHKNVMANLYLHPGKGSWSIESSCVTIFPYIGGGVGVGLNYVNNFHTIAYSEGVGSTTTIDERVFSSHFAWQAGAGLTFSACDNRIAFDLGYRYYCGGKFRTGTKHIINTSTYEGTFGTGPGWKGKIIANQFVIAFRFSF